MAAILTLPALQLQPGDVIYFPARDAEGNLIEPGRNPLALVEGVEPAGTAAQPLIALVTDGTYIDYVDPTRLFPVARP